MESYKASCIIVVTLPAIGELHIEAETKLLLADIVTCKADFEGPLGVPLYKQLEVAQVMDMSCVQCSVGRFQLTSENGRSAWAILDRGGDSADAVVYGGDDEGN